MTDEQAFRDLFRKNGVLLEGLTGPGGASGFQIRVDSDALEQPVVGRVGASTAFLFNEDGSLLWIGLY